ncbi:MAG: hypothetical protein WB784_07700 [Rhodanobacteraceae bacterium]
MDRWSADSIERKMVTLLPVLSCDLDHTRELILHPQPKVAYAGPDRPLSALCG